MKLPTLRTGWLNQCKPGDQVLVGCWAAEGMQAKLCHYNANHARTVGLTQKKLLLVDPTGADCEEVWLLTVRLVELKDGFVAKKRGRPFKNQAD